MAISRESAFERLRAAHAEGRLAHAYLLSGPLGSGKAWLAAQLSAMCLECPPEKVPTHPDAHSIQPESKSRRIVTEQVRDLDHAIQRKPMVSRMKTVVIHDADRMQPQAANAFLKTLEEPPPGSLILLLSTLPAAMLETILSRCVEVPLLGPAVRAFTEEEDALLRGIKECLLQPSQPGAAEGFRFTRLVQSLLADAKDRITVENDAILKAEANRYKQVSEASSWLQDRSEQMKAATEAAALRERERILQIVLDILSRALQAQHGQPSPEPVISALAEKFTTRNLLHRVDALETLRRRLALGVQEALSLESGLLQMILVK